MKLSGGSSQARGHLVWQAGKAVHNTFGCLQREVSKKLHTRLPELSKLLDATLAKAPKEQFGPPSAQLWKRIVVRLLLLSYHAPNLPSNPSQLSCTGGSRAQLPFELVLVQ